MLFELRTAILFGIGASALGSIAGCSSADSGNGSSDPAMYGPSDPTTTPTPTPTPTPTTPVSGSSNGYADVTTGILTAGVWDDNENFDWFMGYRAGVQAVGLDGLLTLTDQEHRSAFDRFTQRAPHQLLDVALVIDTTGSMSDELAYLTQEFSAISGVIAQRHPSAEQRWSLILYRDAGDVYVVRPFDFTSDLQTFQSNLAVQSASGGGDYPEAPDQAFAAARQLGWRSGSSVARMAFWVADAPHHSWNAQVFTDTIRQIRDADIHVYPVASSGVDELTEITMRSFAQVTGGRYLFLTDDSGVGGDHKEPTIPCYYVTKLASAITRVVDVELTGTYTPPDSSEILRTVGNPVDGTCDLSSGQSVSAF